MLKPYTSWRACTLLLVHQDLGLHVTDDLKWKVHIQETTCEAFSALCFLKRNTVEGLSTSTKLKLVKSMVLPILNGSTVWYASKTNLRKLEQTQWKAVKWVLAYGEPNYTVALKRLNLLPLSLYLEFNDILLLSNIISNKIDFDWQPFLKPSQRRNQLFDLMPISNDVQRQNFCIEARSLQIFYTRWQTCLNQKALKHVFWTTTGSTSTTHTIPRSLVPGANYVFVQHVAKLGAKQIFSLGWINPSVLSWVRL